MKNFQECMIEIRKNYKTDSAMSRGLGISRQSIFDIRDGHHTPKDETVIRICKELHLNEEEMLLMAATMRSKGEAKQHWREILKKFENIAAGLLIVIALPAFDAVQCILCKMGDISRKENPYYA